MEGRRGGGRRGQAPGGRGAKAGGGPGGSGAAGASPAGRRRPDLGERPPSQRSPTPSESRSVTSHSTHPGRSKRRWGRTSRPGGPGPARPGRAGSRGRGPWAGPEAAEQLRPPHQVTPPPEGRRDPGAAPARDHHVQPLGHSLPALGHRPPRRPGAAGHPGGWGPAAPTAAASRARPAPAGAGLGRTGGLGPSPPPAHRNVRAGGRTGAASPARPGPGGPSPGAPRTGPGRSCAGTRGSGPPGTGRARWLRCTGPGSR